MRLILVLLAACVAPHRLPGQTVIQFTSFNSSAFSDSTSRMLGWEFTVTQTVTVTQLGWMDWGLDGLVAAHQIGIWQTSDSQLLASETVPAGTSATLVDQFRVIDLSTPLPLQPGVTYRIAGFDPGSSDPHVWDAALSGYPSIEVTGFTIDSRINLGAGLAIGPAVGGFSYPGSTIGDSRSALLGPTFTLAQVPEPSIAWLTLLGVVALTLTSGRRAR